MDDLNEMLGSILNDPESMQQIKELADMLGGNASSSSPSQDMPDMGMLMNMAKLLGGTAADDKNSALLLALKPHLSSERQSKVDRAVKLLKLYSLFITLRDSGMLQNLDSFL